MRCACLIDFEPGNVFNQSPCADAVLRDVGPYDADLNASGHLVSGHALEMLGGFTLIEARDLNEALRIAAGMPFASLVRSYEPSRRARGLRRRGSARA